MAHEAVRQTTETVRRLLATEGAKLAPRRVALQVVTEVVAVLVGVKPCLLFDAWGVTATELCRVVDAITVAMIEPCRSSCGRQLDGGLAVIHLPVASAALEGEECTSNVGHLLVCRPYELGLELQQRLAEDPSILSPTSRLGGGAPLVVDVSADLQLPRFLCRGRRYETLRRHWMDVAQQLTSAGSRLATSREKVASFSLVVPPECCVVALVGLLLGYPCVYFIAGAVSSNCLDMATLSLHRTCARLEHAATGASGDALISSFSYPVECHNPCSSDGSDPAEDRLQEAVKAWATNQRRVYAEQGMLTSVLITDQLVTLPTVAL